MPPSGFIIDNPTVNIFIFASVELFPQVISSRSSSFFMGDSTFYFPQIPTMYCMARFTKEVLEN